MTIVIAAVVIVILALVIVIVVAVIIVVVVVVVVVVVLSLFLLLTLLSLRLFPPLLLWLLILTSFDVVDAFHADVASIFQTRLLARWPQRFRRGR